MTQADRIQGVFRERVQNLDQWILTKEGVYAEINLEEGGLNEGEGSYGGVHPNTWNEYRETFARQVTIEKPADFESLPAEEAVLHITNFKNWYFQKPPKQNFFALPNLLWLVACDAAYLAPAPVVVRIQKLTGDPKPDGVWGSATTERVQAFFQNKTVPDIVQFARELTDLIIARYEEMAQYDAYAEVAPHWIARCERKKQTLLDFVNRENEAASTQAEAAPAEMPSEEQPAEAAPATIDVTAIVEAIEGQSKVIEAQSKVITALRDALLKHTSMSEEILNKLSEMPTQPPEKPQTPRDLLNELPDSLVQ